MNSVERLNEVKQEYLRRMTAGNIHLLTEVEQYATIKTGKMLRPLMTLSAAYTLGEECFSSRRTLLMATCVEMLHNASLLHDDVIDRASTRRGQESVNARWGNGVAVLVGDYILAQIMSLLDEADDRQATVLVNQTVKKMVESELLAIENPSPSESQYLQIIDGKTAQLFATACALGNPAFEEYGLHYGRIFQLKDDLTDGDDTPHTLPLLEKEQAIIRTLPQLKMIV